MTKVVGVRFKENGKLYYFAPGGLNMKIGDSVIVETARCVECGTVCENIKEIEDSELVSPLKPVIRLADEKDMQTMEENKIKEKEAFAICKEKIKEHGLEMDLTEAEYAFDRSKIVFYFTSEHRVDFRELVKDLAAVFHARIELRQIGVRDEAKMIGGFGTCGRPFCCSTFLNDFQPVTIKMAKDQGMSLAPGKISGTCGRLMCCLQYEQSTYEDMMKITPRKGAVVDTKEGRGVVVDSAVLTGKLKVKLDKYEDGAPITFYRDEVIPVKGKQSTRKNSDDKN